MVEDTRACAAITWLKVKAQGSSNIKDEKESKGFPPSSHCHFPRATTHRTRDGTKEQEAKDVMLRCSPT